MDFNDLMPTGGLDAHQNGIHGQLSVVGEDGMASDDVNGGADKAIETSGMTGCSTNISKLDESESSNSSTAEVRNNSVAHMESNGLSASKESGAKGTNNSKQLKIHKIQIKSKNEKTISPRNVSASVIRKGKDGKEAEAASTASNGSHTLSSRPLQPYKSKSFGERQDLLSKQSGKSDIVSSEAPMEKLKPKTLKRVPSSKAEEDSQSSLSPRAVDVKPHRVGKLPNYGFSFRCDERAEKRKEFYTKLEEKIHAKEVERNNLQAKSKETQDAEIKMLRKSLTFKATPMPSFYQEPPPPKVELKKIPPTRAKSPKLGRRKSSNTSESEGIYSQSCGVGRLSLGEKISQNNSLKEVSAVPSKKPQRKSLPSKLPSDKTTKSSAVTGEKPKPKAAKKSPTSGAANAENTTEKSSVPCAASESTEKSSVPKVLNEEKTTEKLSVPDAANDEKITPDTEVALLAETSETDGVLVVEGQVQPSSVQEAISVEH